ncbi:hypothetical protein GCM10007049_20040 [Echinicola pacifica]|uniref:Uncharacterized protein n=1 Tax=Echinicola pacifica TaxID=346377 RepID=A0A918Q066_9BACT|nr:hypothetical protein [Echinicola pacifica]GGZ27259.1 hypothetical protein GCM10007049_20040 [Echinicola pacifica]
MIFYYLSNFYKKTGAHKVHAMSCPEMPDMNELSYLGPYNNSGEAVRNASKKYENVETCEHCCGNKVKSIVEKLRD